MSEFTNNYKTFSDKMDAGNQQYKDLLEQYKQRQALAGGLATGQSGPTFTDLMFNRQPVDNTAKISNLLTGGNQADLAGNKELNDRNDMQVKVGLDAAKGNEEMRWHDMINRYEMARVKAMEDKIGSKTTKDLVKETQAKIIANPAEYQKYKDLNHHNLIMRTLFGAPEDPTFDQFAQSVQDTTPILEKTLGNNDNSVSNGVDVKGHSLTQNGKVLVQDSSGQRGYKTPSMIDHSIYTVVKEGE